MILGKILSTDAVRSTVSENTASYFNITYSGGAA